MSAGCTAPIAHQARTDDVRRSEGSPRRVELFGVHVDLVDPERALETIMKWAEQGRSALVDFMGVHGLTLAQRDAEFKRRLNQFDLVACDGQPVRWALNRWFAAGIGERVYGPALMLAVCRAAAEADIPVYFYGSRVEVLERLTARMGEQFPTLRIVGAESPPYRPLLDVERDEAVERINMSGARIVFLGLGCPKQEYFATDTVGDVRAVQLCVGAAFDLHAGMVPMAPKWMQNSGLEWFYRLCREPRRLWRRYLVGNTQFVGMCLGRVLLGKR